MIGIREDEVENDDHCQKDSLSLRLLQMISGYLDSFG